MKVARAFEHKVQPALFSYLKGTVSICLFFFYFDLKNLLQMSSFCSILFQFFLFYSFLSFPILLYFFYFFLFFLLCSSFFFPESNLSQKLCGNLNSNPELQLIPPASATPDPEALRDLVHRHRNLVKIRREGKVHLSWSKDPDQPKFTTLQLG